MYVLIKSLLSLYCYNNTCSKYILLRSVPLMVYLYKIFVLINLTYKYCNVEVFNSKIISNSEYINLKHLSGECCNNCSNIYSNTLLLFIING